jgi:hypothetical protein
VPPTAKHVQRGGTPRSGKYSLFALADGLIEGGRGGGGGAEGAVARRWYGGGLMRMPKEVVVDQGSAVCPAQASMCSKAAPQRAVSVSKSFMLY